MSPAPNETSISEAQLAANRENAQKSTGPKTEDGKNRCRVNALRHGLTGQFHAMSREDKAAFDIFCTSLLADFQPETFREQTLAISIAEGTWRLSRGRALENNIFAIGMSGEIGDAPRAITPKYMPPSARHASGLPMPPNSRSLPSTNPASAATSKKTRKSSPKFRRSVKPLMRTLSPRLSSSPVSHS